MHMCVCNFVYIIYINKQGMYVCMQQLQDENLKYVAILCRQSYIA